MSTVRRAARGLSLYICVYACAFTSVSASVQSADPQSRLRQAPLRLQRPGAVTMARSWSVVGREEQIILDSDSQATDGFGTAVATNGAVVVVGAPNARIEGTNVPSGAVYVYRREDAGWAREGKLSLASSVSKDYFGWAVGIDRNVLAVGAYLAYGDEKSVGLVYVYGYNLVKQAWVEEKVLGMTGVMDPGDEKKPGWGNSDMPDFYYFGQALALHNGTILVGAYGNDAKGTYAGSAFLYDYEYISTGNGTIVRDSWKQVQRLMPDDLQSFSLFGWSVALSDDVAVVGAYGSTVNTRSYAGSVYVFERTERVNVPWVQVSKLTVADARAHDHFGCAVAVSGGVLAVSSQRASGDKTIADGIVYLYRAIGDTGRRRWIYFKQLQIYTEDSDNIFGFSLSMYDNLLLVGFSGDESFGTADVASAYLYSLISNSEGALDAVRDVSLSPFYSEGLKTGSQARRFGCSVAIHGEIIAVGASQADGTSSESGTVYSYTAGIDYFPVGDSTYDFLVYFLPGAFIAITMISIAFVLIGNTITMRQRRYQAQHGLSSMNEIDLDTSSMQSETSSVSSSTRGLIKHGL